MSNLKPAGGTSNSIPRMDVQIDTIHVIAWFIDFLHDASEGSDMIADFQSTFKLYKAVWISMFGIHFPDLAQNLKFLENEFVDNGASSFITNAKQLLYKYNMSQGKYLFYLNQQGIIKPILEFGTYSTEDGKMLQNTETQNLLNIMQAQTSLSTTDMKDSNNFIMIMPDALKRAVSSISNLLKASASITSDQISVYVSDGKTLSSIYDSATGGMFPADLATGSATTKINEIQKKFQQPYGFQFQKSGNVILDLTLNKQQDNNQLVNLIFNQILAILQYACPGYNNDNIIDEPNNTNNGQTYKNVAYKEGMISIDSLISIVKTHALNLTKRQIYDAVTMISKVLANRLLMKRGDLNNVNMTALYEIFTNMTPVSIVKENVQEEPSATRKSFREKKAPTFFGEFEDESEQNTQKFTSCNENIGSYIACALNFNIDNTKIFSAKTSAEISKIELTPEVELSESNSKKRKITPTTQLGLNVEITTVGERMNHPIDDNDINSLKHWLMRIFLFMRGEMGLNYDEKTCAINQELQNEMTQELKTLIEFGSVYLQVTSPNGTTTTHTDSSIAAIAAKSTNTLLSTDEIGKQARGTGASVETKTDVQTKIASLLKPNNSGKKRNLGGDTGDTVLFQQLFRIASGKIFADGMQPLTTKWINSELNNTKGAAIPISMDGLFALLTMLYGEQVLLEITASGVQQHVQFSLPPKIANYICRIVETPPRTNKTSSLLEKLYYTTFTDETSEIIELDVTVAELPDIVTNIGKPGFFEDQQTEITAEIKEKEKNENKMDTNNESAASADYVKTSPSTLVQTSVQLNTLEIEVDPCANVIVSLLFNYSTTLLNPDYNNNVGTDDSINSSNPFQSALSHNAKHSSNQFYTALCNNCSCDDDEAFIQLYQTKNHLGALDYVTRDFLRNNTSAAWIQGVKLEKAYTDLMQKLPNQNSLPLNKLPSYVELLSKLGATSCTEYYNNWKTNKSIQFNYDDQSPTKKAKRGGSTLKKQKVRKNHTKRKKTKRKQNKQPKKKTRKNRK